MSQTEEIVFAAIFMAIGIAAGIVINQANVMYECEKDRTLTIDGFAWKSATKYDCARKP